MSGLYDEVSCLPGVGKARCAQLSALGIRTLYDLICYLPRGYEDRTNLTHICDLTVGEPACFQAMVTTAPRVSYTRTGGSLCQLQVADESARLKLVFFNRPSLSKQLLRGQTYAFYGTLQGDDRGCQMSNPLFEPLTEPGTVTRRIVPLYSLTAGLSGSVLSRLIDRALTALPPLPELLPKALREQYGLCGVDFAYRAVHFPESQTALAAARRRLIFEEFFIFSAGLILLKSRRSVCAGPVFSDFELEPFLSALPFVLTGAQRRAIEEISADLHKSVPMNRLIQGDVGSGKTMVAAAAAYLCAKNGYQAALMAPTEILAEQHAASLTPLLEPLGVRVALLTGSMKTAARREALDAAALGQAQLIVGTQALLSESTVFQKLGLVIADEQHRFGVSQRAALSAKGCCPHVLVMSATPIPRTLALMLYGDLDVSVIDTLPPGRQSVDTFLVGEGMRARVNAFVRKQVSEGHQVFVVCPAVEAGGDDSLKSAEDWAKTLRREAFPDLRVALLHGQMKGADKERIMAEFAAGGADILVATTVIEVGVDVPNATLMIIENAERFGLSQIHQLRGRVGRGKAKSYCILFSEHRGGDTGARLNALCRTNDGFQIAEEDLKLRGPGDFFGSRQSGLPVFRAASLQTDLETLRQAQEAAAAFLADGTASDNPAFSPLFQRIQALFQSDERVFN